MHPARPIELTRRQPRTVTCGGSDAFPGSTMRLRLCRYAAALAMLGMPTAAVAQLIAPIIPQSDRPGREQQRFIEPPAARAQPRGPVIALPSTVAPEGAENVKLVIRAIQITGSTVY